MPRFTSSDLKALGYHKDAKGDWIKTATEKPKFQSKNTTLLCEKIKKAWKDIIFDVDPMGKPRMTQSDKWKKRKVTDRYWEMKDKLKKISKMEGFVMPEANYHMIFHIGMAKGWSKAKKEEMNGKPHQQKPDKDNLEKAVLDALCVEDSYVYDGRVTKLWAYKGSIEIKNIKVDGVYVKDMPLSG